MTARNSSRSARDIGQNRDSENLDWESKPSLLLRANQVYSAHSMRATFITTALENDRELRRCLVLAARARYGHCRQVNSPMVGLGSAIRAFWTKVLCGFRGYPAQGKVKPGQAGG